MLLAPVVVPPLWVPRLSPFRAAAYLCCGSYSDYPLLASSTSGLVVQQAIRKASVKRFCCTSRCCSCCSVPPAAALQAAPGWRAPSPAHFLSCRKSTCWLTLAEWPVKKVKHLMVYCGAPPQLFLQRQLPALRVGATHSDFSHSVWNGHRCRHKHPHV